MKHAAWLPVMVLLLAGCAPAGSKGRDLTFAQASDYFAARQDRLAALVALLDACRPVDATGYADVWRDGTAGAKRCAKGDQAVLGEIKTWLATEDFVAAGFYTADRHPMSLVAGVEIITHAQGLGVSGTLTKFSYSATPEPGPVRIERRQDGSVISETRALTPAPFHWFWEHAR